jgi:hypothetical protein
MPNKEWTDEEVQKEISEAVQIVRADKIDALIRMRLSTKSDNENGDKNNPPPSGGGDNNPPIAKKKSLWWGTEE